MTPRNAALRKERQARMKKAWDAAGVRLLEMFKAARDRTKPGSDMRLLWDQIIERKETELAKERAALNGPAQE